MIWGFCSLALVVGSFSEGKMSENFLILIKHNFKINYFLSLYIQIFFFSTLGLHPKNSNQHTHSSTD